ncbi:MAG: histidine phosphatase family protein [Elusimicrobia bacterium]|nr:histidine phosphatase family protein [Elusimicrobiota bacterium]
MKILVIRHGPAGGAAEKEKWKGKDRLRPLSALGKKKTAEGAKGLARAAEVPELIATSPLVRAMQTAELVAKRLPAPIVETEALSPEAAPEATLRWLLSRREKSVAVVGHEPQLGRLIAWLCAASTSPVTELKKGQACLIELRGRRPGDGRLIWSLTPKQLRRIGTRN